MNSQFQRIALIGKQGEPSPAQTLRDLLDYLTAKGPEVVLEQETAERLGDSQTPCIGMDQLAQSCDLAMVVGGDGTLLHTARELADHPVALLGINLGRLGFLVDISPKQMVQALDQILAGNYEEERRSLLVAEVDGRQESAFNDVVIHKWNTARMIEFETYIDGSFVDSQRSDGLIVSTPTGSTAYALSGGGPLLYPALNATVLVPICPHTLSNRPLVISGDSRIEIVISNQTDTEQVRVTCDGQNCLPLTDDRIHIRKHRNRVHLIHPKGHDHYDILRAKLGWGGHRN